MAHKIIDISTKGSEKGEFFIDSFMDIHDTEKQANVAGEVVGKVIVDSFGFGCSIDEYRQRALEAWRGAF